MNQHVLEADYRLTEIDVMLHLCEKIDRDADEKAHAALGELHAIMRRHIDALNEIVSAMAGDPAR